MTTTAYDDPTTWRLTTTTGIKYRLLGMTGSFDKEKAETTVNVLVASADLVEFAEAIFPPIDVTGDFPAFPARDVLTGTQQRAKSLSWKPHIQGMPVDVYGQDPTASSGTYQPNVEVAIKYESSPEEDENDPETFLEISADVAGEFIHTSAPKGVWNAAQDFALDENNDPVEVPFNEEEDVQKNKLQNTAVNLLVAETQWDVSWPRVPSNFWRDTMVHRLRSYLGCVNEAKMPVLFNAPKETILFLGFSLRRSWAWRQDDDEPETFNLNMKFLEKFHEDGRNNNRIIGHNHFWKADKGWERLLIDGVNPVYELSS